MQLALFVPWPFWRTTPWTIRFVPSFWTWIVKVFEALIVNDEAWLFARLTTANAPPLPVERASSMFCPDVLPNETVVFGFSLPGLLFSSPHVAVTVPKPGIVAIVNGVSEPLSMTSALRPNTNSRGTVVGSRNFEGSVPRSSPDLRTATSLPAAKPLLAPDDVALFPSTAPELRAKLTTAAAEPVIANTSAMSETTIEGDGLPIFLISDPPILGSRDFQLGDRRKVAPPYAGCPVAKRINSTRAVRAGLPSARAGEPFLPGPTFAAPFHLPGDPEASPYVYGRYGSPTWDAYESAVGELEGGEAVVFASGMAAITAVLSSFAAAGETLVVPADGYFTGRRVAADLQARGTAVREVPTDTAAYVESLEGAALVFVETPSNPGLGACDVAEVVRTAHASGVLVAVDNTLATPLLQRPLDLGADLSLAAATKALSGHADLLIGYVAARDPGHLEALRGWRLRTGSLAGPFETWLAHRSLATAGLRLERQCSNALTLAGALAARDDVTGVRYPGLPDDPAHEVAARQMEAFGPVLAFDLGERGRAERFLEACELVIEATSFGGVHTTAERRARWGGDDVGEGFIRLSAGIEDPTDLLADVAQALGRG
jgi:cystathionine gamma-lyase